MYKFSSRLREIREENHFTQKQTAKLLEISETGYAGWEQGRTEPNIEMIKKICILFKITSDYLLGLTENSY